MKTEPVDVDENAMRCLMPGASPKYEFSLQQ